MVVISAHAALAGCSEPTTSSAFIDDAGRDATSPAAFCARAPAGTFYCNDFDDDAEVGAMSSTLDNGRLVLDDLLFVSPPRSLRATSFLDAGPTSSAYVQAVTDRSPSRVSISFELRGATSDAIYYILAEIVVGGVGTLRLSATNNELAVDEEMLLGGTETVYLHAPQAGTWNDGAWHEVSLTLDMSTSPTQITSAFDGSTHTDSAHLTWARGPISVQYGLQKGGAAPAADIEIDDVLVVGD